MNNTNLLFNQKVPVPNNWYISTPNLYGGNKLWDIAGGQSATLLNLGTQTVWKGYSDKPGALGGCVSTRASSSGGEIDLLLTKQNSFTIMCWVKIASTGTAGMIFATQFASLRCGSAAPGTININAGTPSTLTFTTETWTHFALTVNRATGSVQRGYINGKSACSYTSVVGNASCVVSSLGNKQDSPASNKQLKGDFDDIMVFDFILSEEQIRNVYLSSFVRKQQIAQFLQEGASTGSPVNSYLLSMLMGGQF